MDKWITFDLDGTLMQNPFVGHVFPEIEKRISDQNNQLTQIVQQLVIEHETRLNAEKYVEAYDWDNIVAHYLEMNDIDTPINVEEILLGFCTAPAIYLLEENILDVLDDLHQKGYLLAVVTNGFKKYQLPVMDVLKLTSHFDMIVTPEEVGYAKPDKRVFGSIKELGEIVAHVGDRIDHDILSANAIGVQSIWINRKLPKQLQDLPPHERSKDAAIKELVHQKLEKETKKQFGRIPMEAIPQAVIYSIMELSDIL